MCGICGYIDLNNGKRLHKNSLHKMVETLSHRGPDDTGTFFDDNIALGFTRLSIIDIDGGHQPVQNEDKQITLICNGEIFNYLELRDDLTAKGHVFKTNCDVEVILHLYEEYGADFINQLNGQFAFALYDKRIDQLLCARDHVGIAPFFYTIYDGIFIFASEIKAILEYPGIKREVDLTGLDQIFNFPGIISPYTLFKNIKSLESGNYLAIHRSRRIEQREYWDLIYPKKEEAYTEHTENYYIETLDDLLTRAVKYRLQADVPVGFYISGGIDSSIIAAKINRLTNNQKRHSFSIDFPDKTFSESKYQRIMANRVNSIHHEMMFNYSDIAGRLNKVIYHSECALKETYNTASLALSENVRNNNIKVVLTGEGADELFGGYIGYRFDKMKQSHPEATSSGTPDECLINKTLWGDENFLYEKQHAAFSQTLKRLYSDEVNNIYNEINCLNRPAVNHERIRDVDIFHKRSYIDFKLRMSDHLLSDHGDRMAFANSVEARYPFLDKNVIDFAVTMPVSLKLKDYTEKYILKRISQNSVPDEIINRPKFAFVAPGSPDLLKMNSDYINDILSYNVIKKQRIFNPDTVENIRKQYTQENFKLNVPYDTDLLITVITLGIFLDEFKLSI